MKRKVVVTSAEFSAAASSRSSLPAPLQAEVAFAGRSNVGKSTLLSALSGRHGLARASKDPGRTRSLVFFDVHLKVGAGDEATSARLGFVDLPGYGYAKISKSESAAWKPLIEGFLRERLTLRTVLVLVDIRRGPEDEERELLEFLAAPGANRPPLSARVVATKLDKLPRHARKPALSALQKELGVPVHGVSGETGEGIEELWNVIVASCL